MWGNNFQLISPIWISIETLPQNILLKAYDDFGHLKIPHL